MVARRLRIGSLLADDAVLDAVLAAGAAVLLGGAILVAWAQVHDLPVAGSDLAPVYLGWLITSGALAGRVAVAVRAGDSVVNALPKPYRAAVVAALVFGAAALGDSVYVTAAGFGRGLEALVSPFHVIEILCGGMLASTPLRAALGRHQATGTIPVLVSAGLLMATLSFFTQFASPATDLWASHPPAAPASLTWWAAQDLGAAGILLHATLLVSVSLFLVRHFRLRAGSLTLVAAIGAAFALSLKSHWELLPALIAPGVAADLAVWWLAPSLGAAGAARRMGAIVPAVFTIAYWINLSVTDGTWWSGQLWIGLVITAAVLGWLAGYLVVPAGAGEEPSTPGGWVDALAAGGGPVGADDVKWALERLDDRRGLAASPLVRLPAVATPEGNAPDALRTLLTELVRDLAAASDPRDAEAGRVLHSAYVRRAGPHETVAEALHLSRPTYFRRLQRGLQLLAARVEEHSTFVARAS